MISVKGKKMRTLLILASAFLLPLTSHSQEAVPGEGSLNITITNIENGSGTLYVAILNSDKNWLKSDTDALPFRDVAQPITNTDDLVINVGGLPPGEYAVSVFQDIDGNTELDTNFIGYPKEPFGFSAPMGKFGPPDFSEAAITISGGTSSVEVSLN